MQYTLLYEFSLGSKVWRYTANAEDVIDPSSVVWEAAAISDEGVSTSGSATADTLTINSSIDIVPARLWMHSRPGKVMDVRILRAELPSRVARGDDEGLDNTVDPRLIPVSNLRVHYVGEVAQCSFGTPGTAAFLCETLSASMNREGLSQGWQRSCPHVIYDPLTCGVDKALHAHATFVESISGNTITVSPGASPADFAAGLLEYEHPIKGGESLTIEAGDGTTLAIFDGVGDLYVGMPVTIYRGCNQSPASCVSFNNLPRYGGVPNLTGSSPFDGTSSPVF